MNTQLSRKQALVERGGAPGVVLMGPARQMLNAQETTQLLDCEKRIEKGMDAFLDVASALITVRDGRLYRFKFSTFENYCQERWAISARRARQLCAGAEVVANLQTAPSGGARLEDSTEAAAAASSCQL